MTVYIYGLIDPRDHQVKYVGRTSQKIEQRLQHHRGAARRPVSQWLRELPAQPTLVCLEIVSRKHGGGGEAAKAKWVKRFRPCLNALTPPSQIREQRLHRVRQKIRELSEVTLRDLKRKVHAERFSEQFDWAVDWLEKNGKIVVESAGNRQKLILWASD